MAMTGRRGTRAALVALGLLLAACSGGDDDGAESTTTTTEAPDDETSTTTTVPEVDGFAATTVAAGDQHACALDPDGAAWCWGYNRMGQLGDGTLEARLEPTPVAPAS